MSQTSIQNFFFPLCLLRKVFEKSSQLIGQMGILGKGHACRTGPYLSLTQGWRMQGKSTMGQWV